MNVPSASPIPPGALASSTALTTALAAQPAGVVAVFPEPAGAPYYQQLPPGGTAKLRAMQAVVKGCVQWVPLGQPASFGLVCNEEGLYVFARDNGAASALLGQHVHGGKLRGPVFVIRNADM